MPLDRSARRWRQRDRLAEPRPTVGRLSRVAPAPEAAGGLALHLPAARGAVPAIVVLLPVPRADAPRLGRLPARPGGRTPIRGVPAVVCSGRLPHGGGGQGEYGRAMRGASIPAPSPSCAARLATGRASSLVPPGGSHVGQAVGDLGAAHGCHGRTSASFPARTCVSGAHRRAARRRRRGARQ